MNQLQKTLQARLAMELASYREVLVLDAPIVQAHALYDAPALFQAPDGTFFVAGMCVPQDSRPATNREAIELLEGQAERFVWLEAASISSTALTLIEDDETRTEALQYFGTRWPWSTTSKHEFSLFWARHELHMQFERMRRAEATVSELQALAMPWPDGIEPREVIEFVSEAYRRSSPEQAKRYLDWCNGVAEIRAYEVNQVAEPRKPISLEIDRTHHKLETSAVLLRERVGKPGSIIVDARLSSSEALDGLLVTGEQLAWLYWAIPEPIRTARKVRTRIEALASGDAQRELVDVIAPEAIKLEDPGAAAPDNTLSGRLAEAVRNHLKVFFDKHFSQPVPATASMAIRRALELDEGFATALEQLKEKGQSIASMLRARSTDRAPGEEWKLWQREKPGERFLVLLARALWTDQVKLEVRALRQRVTGLPAPLVQFVASAHTRGNSVCRDESDAAQAHWLLDSNGHRTEFDTQFDAFADRTSGISIATLEQLQHEAKLMGSIEAIGLLHFYADRCRWHHDHRGDFVDEFCGAEGLARIAGLRGVDAASKIVDILNGQNRLRGSYHGVEFRGLVGYVYDRARGQKQASLRLTYLEPLRPTFSYYLKARLGNRPISSEAVQVVPLVGLPPLFGGRQAWAQQANCALRVSAFMRQRVDEAFERAGVQIPRREFERLLLEAGFARRYVGATAEKALANWTQPGGANKAPAFLERIEGTSDRFTFGPAHVEARIALAEAGSRSAKGREMGQARASAKVGGPHRPRRRSKKQ